MLRFVLLLASAALVFGLPRHRGLDGKIVGGQPVTIDQFPHQGSVQYYDSHICGGSILDAGTFLTAAHCIINTDPRDFSIRVGSTYHATGGQKIGVSNIYVHPKYNSSNNNDYDVAILMLASPINIDYVSTYPVSLARTEPSAGDNCWVSGWGALSSGGSGPSDLRAVSVPIISRDQCNQQYGGGISDRMICCLYEYGGKDSCQGDSGGPLIDRNRIQVGIVSWGIGCADARYPGVYTNVADPEISSFIGAYRHKA